MAENTNHQRKDRDMKWEHDGVEFIPGHRDMWHIIKRDGSEGLGYTIEILLSSNSEIERIVLDLGEPVEVCAQYNYSFTAAVS